jgi:signal transduction histidine kinase
MSQLQELLELTYRLSEPLEVGEVAQIVVDQAQAAVGAVTAMLWLVEDPPTHATLRRSIGLEPPVAQQYVRIPLESWLPMGDAMLRCEPLFFESRAMYRERYEEAEKQSPRRWDGRELSYACLPLVAHGRAIGGVSIVFPHQRTFAPDERMFLTVFARHAAQALERASLFERERQARQQLESLQQLTSALSSVATVDAVAKLATRICVETLGFAVACLWTSDEQGDLHLLGDHGMTADERESLRHIPHDSQLPAARVARERRPEWTVPDAVLPLVIEDRTLGVLSVGAGRAPDESAFLIAVAGHCADALARARLHDDARNTKHLLQSVLAHLPVGVIVSRPPDSTLVLSNDALGRIWHIESLPQRSEDRCKMLNTMYPDGRPIPRSDSPVLRALQGEVVDAMEARIARSDGTQAWVQASAAPVLRSDGSVEVAVAAFIDITALKEARAAADEAGRVKDEFLAMLGHELRNPLTPIVTALDLMDLRGGEAFRGERTIISRQVRHMVRLVDDLLDIARVTRGKILLQKEPIEVAEAIASAIETTRPLFEQRAQQLTLSVPARGLRVVADRGRLSQAIANLLTNAAKYTEPRGRITVGAARQDGQVSIWVRDTGIGIDPEVLPTVFDLFVQSKRTLDRAQGGLGIGLTIARNLVELHDGAIAAHSDGIGQGSEFVIRLPALSGGEAGMDLDGDRPGEGGAKPWRVLILDDNEEIADGLAALIEALGCITCVAYDGPSAIAAAERFVADLALIDIGLPVMDGYEVARQFRRAPATAHMRLVAVTGYGQSADERRSVEAGFDEHIVKPCGLDTLRDVLARIASTGR